MIHSLVVGSHLDRHLRNFPVNRDRASDPMDSTTGVARSMPTSAISSCQRQSSFLRPVITGSSCCCAAPA